MQVRREQPLPIRLLHWLNAPVLLVMGLSGLQIWNASPELGPKGALYRWYPLQGRPAPRWMTAGDWLAGARHLHFALAWLLVLTGVAWVVYLAATGEWRRRLFLPRRDAQNAAQTALHYVRLRPAPAKAGLYNGLQRLAYSSALALGAIEVLSGLALYKPVQLSFLTALFGGYDGARAVHLLVLVGLVFFTAGHLLLVLLHPRELSTIFTGGERNEAA